MAGGRIQACRTRDTGQRCRRASSRRSEGFRAHGWRRSCCASRRPTLRPRRTVPNALMATITAAISGMPMASETTIPKRSVAPIQAQPGSVGWVPVRLSRAASAKLERTTAPPPNTAAATTPTTNPARITSGDAPTARTVVRQRRRGSQHCRHGCRRQQATERSGKEKDAGQRDKQQSAHDRDVHGSFLDEAARARLEPCTIKEQRCRERGRGLRRGVTTIQAVADPEDLRLADYVRLRDASLRRSIEAAGGLFIAEGEKVIRRAVEAGYRPRSFLLAEQVTGFHVHRGALASLHREQRHTVTDLLERRRLVVLEDIVDHTNVGAILRNAAALGWDGALLSPRTADPLFRRAVKVSMGAVFSLPWARLEDWGSAPVRLTDAGFTTVALTLTPDAAELDQVAFTLRPDQPVAIMLGTEGAGLSTRWTEGATVRARIPMTAGIDSLNVAAASAIACYALSTRGLTGQSAG